MKDTLEELAHGTKMGTAASFDRVEIYALDGYHLEYVLPLITAEEFLHDNINDWMD